MHLGRRLFLFEKKNARISLVRARCGLVLEFFYTDRSLYRLTTAQETGQTTVDATIVKVFTYPK